MYPVINGLTDHDAQIIAFKDISTPIPKQSFSLIRKVDNNTIRNFVSLLSYENWENAFFVENVNIIYNNFVNLRIFYASFPFVKLKNSQNSKPWLTKVIKISSK
jgi:hypothetical protein